MSLNGSDYLTTGQAASIMGCSVRTIANWTDSGKLPARRIPGSMDRRIRKQDLGRFMLRAGYHQEAALLLGHKRPVVLLLGLPTSLADDLAELIHGEDFEVVQPSCEMEAGAVASAKAVASVVLDVGGLGRASASVCTRWLAALEGGPRVRIGLLPEDSSTSSEEAESWGMTTTLQHPVRLAALAKLMLATAS